MDVNQHFIKIYPPSSEQYSPKKADQTSRQASFRIQASQLVELRIGNFIVRAERISNNQTIDGYAALFDQRNNLLYEGQFLRSKRNGFGLQYSPQGTLVFQGFFRDDKYDGWGHSSIYTGEYRDGLYDGYGVLSMNNLYYQGFFHRGQFSGEGVNFTGPGMLTFHPIKSVNSFLAEGLKNNLDIMEKYNIQQIYIGEWKQGCKHGFGRLWRKDYWYSGQFSNDLPHGFGAEEDKKNNKVTQTKYRLGVKAD